MIGTLRRTEIDEWRIVEGLYPSLHRFACVAAPWDLDADDLLHDVLVDVMQHRRLEDLDHPGAYLRRAMLNTAAGYCRRRSSRRRALSRLAGGRSHGVAPQYPSDLVELERLCPRDRAVVYLADVEGLPFAEVAEMVGCSEAAARKRASRARAVLRRELIREEGP